MVVSHESSIIEADTGTADLATEKAMNRNRRIRRLGASSSDMAFTKQQIGSEQTYDITIATADYLRQLSPQEIVNRMEVDHVVKTAPRLPEQINDTSRTNRIIYIASDKYIGTSTATDLHYSRRVICTEQEAIDNTYTYLETAVALGTDLDTDAATQAVSLRDNLTYIGEKEYQEATTGIALYWKAMLDRDPEQQILALAGGIAKAHNYHENGKLMVKSDDYLLDNILAHFSDEEVKKYRGRLITDSQDITATEAHNLKVVLVDDWTITGSQLQGAASDFRQKYPQFASSVEIQLIAANNERITRGLSRIRYDSPDNNELSVPVRAYFKAHDAPSAFLSKAHITGSYSSVDFNAVQEMTKITGGARHVRNLDEMQRAVLFTLPPMANIVPPYRLEDFQLTQRERFRVSKKDSDKPLQ